MTSEEVMGIINSSKTIGKNVFNFFDKFKEYELLLVKFNRPLTDNNELLERDVLISYINDEYKPQFKNYNLLKIYDEIKFRMTWKEISGIYQTTQTLLNCERYDITNATKVSEYCVSFVDRTTGERCFMATDQVLNIMTYQYEEECKEINFNTGEVEINKINQGKDKFGTDKHRNNLWYRD